MRTSVNMARDISFHLDRGVDSLFQAVLEALAGGSVFTADKVVLASTGKVSALIDWLDETHQLTQATDGLRVAAPLEDLKLNGQRTLAFTAAQAYLSNRAASSWGYLHKGTGAFALAVFVPSTDGASALLNTLFATYRGQDAASSHGVNCLYTTTTSTGTLQVRVVRGAGTFTIDQTALVTQFSQDVPASVRFTYLEGATPEYDIRKNGASLASGSSLNAPSSSDPSFTLTVGANANTLDRKLNGRLAFLALAPKVPSAIELQTISSYLTQKYGMAA